jgi:hypothetical protein
VKGPSIPARAAYSTLKEMRGLAFAHAADAWCWGAGRRVRLRGVPLTRAQRLCTGHGVEAPNTNATLIVS